MFLGKLDYHLKVCPFMIHIQYLLLLPLPTNCHHSSVILTFDKAIISKTLNLLLWTVIAV